MEDISTTKSNDTIRVNLITVGQKCTYYIHADGQTLRSNSPTETIDYIITNSQVDDDLISSFIWAMADGYLKGVEFQKFCF
jgi:hypothetical protein